MSSDNCHMTFREYVDRLRRTKDKRWLRAVSGNPLEFKNGGESALSPFQKEFIQMAAFQKLQQKKSAKS